MVKALVIIFHRCNKFNRKCRHCFSCRITGVRRSLCLVSSPDIADKFCTKSCAVHADDNNVQKTSKEFDFVLNSFRHHWIVSDEEDPEFISLQKETGRPSTLLRLGDELELWSFPAGRQHTKSTDLQGNSIFD